MATRVKAFVARWYVMIVVIAWIFMPEVRRIVDWQVGFSSLPIINLIPLVMLAPGFYLIARQWSRVGLALRVIFSFWIAAFAYAFIVAFASGGLISGTYEFATFVLPAGLAFLIAGADGGDTEAIYDRVCRTILFGAAIASVYGIYQYISPPIWDVFWVQHAELDSIGDPVPFGLRIFGPLNSQGPLSIFLTFAILVNLPRIKLTRPLVAILLAPCFIALILTLVRTAWIALIIGIVVYLFLSPRKREPIVAMAMLGLTCIVLAFVLANTVKGAGTAVYAITQRFTTFQDLNDDSSVVARRGETSDTLVEALREPLGQGLGASGLSTKLSTGSGGGIDNGYLTRLFEMGVFGGALYLASVLLAVGASVACYARYSRAKRPGMATIAAVCIAVQVVLIWLDAAFDNHTGFGGLFFWFSIYFASMGLTSLKPRDAFDRQYVTYGREPAAVRPALS